MSAFIVNNALTPSGTVDRLFWASIVLPTKGLRSVVRQKVVFPGRMACLIHSVTIGARVVKTFTLRQSNPENGASNWAWFSAI